MTMNALFAPRDTKAALQPLPLKDCSRSLYFDRYSRPDLAKEERQQFFTDGFTAHRSAIRCASWAGTLQRMSAAVLHAQLQSRLMVNMAGGVMENAGLLLDRFGLPYIPGSAVKGCARRAALAALHEWCETNQKPGVEVTDHDNLFKAACEPFTAPAEMLASIARVFGWCEQDWRTRGEVLKGTTPKRDEDDAQFQARCEQLWRDHRSDFAWACSGTEDFAAPAPTGRNISAQGNALGTRPQSPSSPEGAAQSPSAGWDAIRVETLSLLGSAPASGAVGGAPAVRSDDTGGRREGASANGRGARAPRLKDFAGSVSFLPAYPVDLGKTGQVEGLTLDVPELGKLELDVLTCHHREYYASTDPKAVATDTEEPVPIVFPAVAPGHVFAFALLPLRGAEELVKHARAWLKTGVETFGLGAKTNAGYGWFRDVTEGVKKALSDVAARRAIEQQRQQDEERRKAEEAERLRKAQEIKAATANMTPDEKADYEIKDWDDNRLKNHFDRHSKLTPEQQGAVYRLLRGAKAALWQEIRKLALEGKAKERSRWGAFTSTMFAMAKQRGEKLP